MKTILSKVMMGILTVSLAFAGLPLGTAHAAGLTDTSTPPATAKGEKSGLRLEQAFARETKVLNKVGKLYEQADAGFPKIQKRIDKAKAHGLDVAAVQAAFDAAKKALTDAHPLYNQAKSVLESHNGFDAAGKVTDPVAARETVKSLHDTAKQFKDALDGTLKALHEAVKTLRESRQTPTPAPTN